MTLPLLVATAVALLAILAEWLHARRCRRVARLAFGPVSRPRAWTRLAPPLRVLGVALLAFGLLELYLLAPRAARPQLVPDGGFRHLVIALDVSPSMQLKDAGAARDQTRAKRASEVVLSVLGRAALDQLRVSVVAFYTKATPVVVDTYDIEVVKNILDGLPLEMAFQPGKTSLLEGIRESIALAEKWEPGSTTLFIVSDGDTVPDAGMPQLPRSIRDVLIVGVGSARSGQNIDGHLSRQDASTLRQLATRLRGAYHDVNEKHLPSAQLAALSQALPMRDHADKGRRELALAAVATGAALLSLLPLALAFFGAAWQPHRRNPANAQPLSSAARRETHPFPKNSSGANSQARTPQEQ